MGESYGQMTFPPHARGWTWAAHRRIDVPVVSPARAGMDPYKDFEEQVNRCFPRTRGDGPGTRC